MRDERADPELIRLGVLAKPPDHASVAASVRRERFTLGERNGAFVRRRSTVGWVDVSDVGVDPRYWSLLARAESLSYVSHIVPPIT